MRKLFLSTMLALGVAMGSAYAADVVVKVAPPKAVVEHRGTAPSKDHVWVGGYHRWDGHNYVWEKGRWEMPPHPHAAWVAPRWTHHKEGYVFTEGHWK
jgi:opacity protein-like surface antigen